MEVGRGARAGVQLEPLFRVFGFEAEGSGRKREVKGGVRVRTPSVSAYKYDGEFKGETGANYRMIVSMDDEEASYYVVDTGVSENQLSKRRTDQMELWRENK